MHLAVTRGRLSILERYIITIYSNRKALYILFYEHVKNIIRLDKLCILVYIKEYYYNYNRKKK